VIEIRDGRRALRPYTDRPDAEAQSPDQRSGGNRRGQPLIEATKIKQAIRAKESGHSPVNDQDASGFGDRHAKTFAAEVLWLTQVSVAYGRCGLTVCEGSLTGVWHGFVGVNGNSTSISR
jgi:hypothetical protein